MLGGRLTGVQDLEIHKGANLILYPDGKINSYNISHMELRSLEIFGAGLVSYTGVADEDHQLLVNITENFHVKGGGLLQANNLFLEGEKTTVDITLSWMTTHRQE